MGLTTLIGIQSFVSQVRGVPAFEYLCLLVASRSRFIGPSGRAVVKRQGLDSASLPLQHTSLSHCTVTVTAAVVRPKLLVEYRV
jgi:hypothetical protein